MNDRQPTRSAATLCHASTLMLLLFLASSLAACGGTSQATTDAATVVEQLRARGLNVQPAGTARQRRLSQPGRAYIIGTGTLEIYEYRSEAAAVLDVRQIDQADLSPAPTVHIYQGRNLIVLYFGNDLDVEQALDDIVGPAF